ncbi:MAG: GNAT family N-acetyltransferase [Candidatus Anstonellaceae archaeon]
MHKTKGACHNTSATPAAKPGGGTRFDDQSLHDSTPAHQQSIISKILRLDGSMVAPTKKEAKNSEYVHGERLFMELLSLLRRNFPPSEIESESQFREYFHDKYSQNWFVEVALDSAGKVIGASLYSYYPQMDAVIYNIVVTSPEARRSGIASKLVQSMVENSDKISREQKGHGLFCVIAEIERPDASLNDDMRNIVRPHFHDTTSLVRAIKLSNGEPLVYLLPIMATDAERKAAEKDGKPLEPEPLMFCIRPLAQDEKQGISAREAARLLISFYKDYLEKQCSGVKPEEANALLASALAKIAWKSNLEETIAKMLPNIEDSREQILNFMPNENLSFMKISETKI